MARKKEAESKPLLRVVTAEEARKLHVGMNVNINGKDANGNERKLACVVAFNSGRKFLTYRNNGKLCKCEIKEYPGKYYTLEA